MKMNQQKSLLAIFITLMAFSTTYFFFSENEPDPELRLEKMHYPSDQFFLQRSWPDTAMSLTAYENAIQYTKRQIRQNESLPSRSTNGIASDWTLQGPGNIGGRFNVVTIHPTSNDTIYAGSASGGVFKTVDGGQNWAPIFDDQSYLSVSAITLDPNDPNTVYVGTGDHNISGYPFIGDGIYKSTDGGTTWNYLGLKEPRIISRIVIDPSNSNNIYVATMGIPFVRNNDRGLYKSTDGGLTWTNVLFVADQAGIIDLVINPNNPQIIYASSWDRIRNNSESIVAGTNAKIWKTIDGGTTWNALGGGLPTGVQGRIGLDMFNPNPDTLFALYINTSSNLEGLYRTYNGGVSWTNISGDLPNGFTGGFGWYFGQIRVHPTNPDTLWALGVSLYYSANGGTNWNLTGFNTHADKHDLKYGLNNDIFLATDGGLYSSSDNGLSWIDIENIPNNQFYRVAVNPFQPNDFYGGLQDNGSVGGNANGFDFWSRYFGADGFQMAFSATNSQHWYAETQNGVLWYSTNGGSSFNWHGNGIDANDRRSWDMPFALSLANSDRQYCGTYRVYRNLDGVNANWIAISPDITDGINSRYHVISTVDESPLDTNVVYAATTDGNVWITTNNGSNWTDITDTLPDRYVTSIKGSPIDSSRLFVSHSGYKDNDNSPHIHRSDDYGMTWQSISGDLPPLAINDLYILPSNDSVLFVANDGGVYATIDAGTHWERIGNNMPIVAIYDLEIEPTNNLLVAGSFGRSLWTFPIDSVFIPKTIVPTPNIQITGNTTICAGDSVVLAAIGANYDGFLWSNGDTTQSITVLTSNTFSVIGIINGCQSDVSSIQSITVNPNPAKPIITSSGSIQFCEGDSVTINAPTGFSSYTWNTGVTTASITTNQSGVFTVFVTDSNNCVSPISDTLTTIVNANPLAPMITGSHTICDGNSVTLLGPLGFSGYLWAPNFFTRAIMVNAPGTYFLTVTDSNGCMSPASEGFVVNTGTAPTAAFVSDTNSIDVDFTNTSLNEGLAPSFHWDFGDGTTDSVENPIHSFPGSGGYTVTFIVTNDCGSDTTTGFISVIAADLDPDFAWKEMITVWPNPASEQISVEITDLFKPRFEIQLIDLQGRVIYQKKKNNQAGTLYEEIDVSHLATGMYILHFFDGENRFARRVIKR